MTAFLSSILFSPHFCSLVTSGFSPWCILLHHLSLPPSPPFEKLPFPSLSVLSILSERSWPWTTRVWRAWVHPQQVFSKMHCNIFLFLVIFLHNIFFPRASCIVRTQDVIHIMCSWTPLALRLLVNSKLLAVTGLGGQKSHTDFWLPGSLYPFIHTLAKGQLYSHEITGGWGDKRWTNKEMGLERGQGPRVHFSPKQGASVQGHRQH